MAVVRGKGCVTLSMQYAFPLPDFPSALAAFAQAAVRDGHAGRVVEIKFLSGAPAASKTLLGYNYDGDVACLNVWWQIGGVSSAGDAVSRLDRVERAMQQHAGRPHWGKLHRCSLDYLGAVFGPGLGEFADVEEELRAGGAAGQEERPGVWTEKSCGVGSG